MKAVFHFLNAFHRSKIQFHILERCSRASQALATFVKKTRNRQFRNQIKKVFIFISVCIKVLNVFNYNFIRVHSERSFNHKEVAIQSLITQDYVQNKFSIRYYFSSKSKFSLVATFYITKRDSRTKNSPIQLSCYRFVNVLFLPNNADFLRKKMLKLVKFSGAWY